MRLLNDTCFIKTCGIKKISMCVHVLHIIVDYNIIANNILALFQKKRRLLRIEVYDIKVILI